MKFTTQIATLILAATASLAAPSPVDSALQARATKMCDSFDETTAGPYTFYHNNWGAAQASSGSQCTTFNDIKGRTASWSTSWTWAGGPGQVKSYSNVALEKVNKQLSAVKSIPSSWTWSYTGSNLIADVSYDLWLAPTEGGSNKYEIMVWLAALGGAGPISSTGSKVATATVGGHAFDLFSGPNGDTTVFSFVAQQQVKSFSGDLNDFFKYLVANEGVSSASWITSLQAGTEPFSGSGATFTTSAYTISVS